MTVHKVSTAHIKSLAPREDFPILAQSVRGVPLVFLDSAASSQKPRQVIDSMSQYYETCHANVHRGAYYLSEQASARYENARITIAKFIHARSAKEIIYTRNTTEGLNVIAQTWGLQNIHSGDVILLTEMEHHSNIVPWQMLAQRSGAKLVYTPVTDDGRLDTDTYYRLLREQTPKLVSFSLMSNVLGVIPPAKEMIAAAHSAGAVVICDGAQYTAHYPTDVRDLDCDFLAFSGHKMLGPTGIGILYGKRALLEAMPPFLGGGDMIREVHLQSFSAAELPWKFEAGTPAIAEVIGLEAAIMYLQNLQMTRVAEHDRAITEYTLGRLSELPWAHVIGPVSAENRGATISFTIDGLHPHDAATLLDRDGIAVRAGHHCAQPLMERFNIPATARASGYVYTTSDEIDALIASLRKAHAAF